MKFLILLSILIIPFLINEAYGQTIINVTASQPCFLNYTAGLDMWSNCGFQDDFLAAVILPFEWVTGGLFSMIVVVILIIMTYVKYHTVIYPIAIGIAMLPISWFLFPDLFIVYGILMAGIGIAAVIWSIVVQRTNSQ